MDINSLFEAAADKQASDIHLAVGLPPIMRIDGALVNMSELVSTVSGEILTSEYLQIFVDSLLSRELKNTLLTKRDLDLSYQVKQHRFRVNISFEKGNLKIVARVINSSVPSLEEIDMPGVIKEILDLPQGFVLVTGPTGCGKSTTLAAMIEHINIERRANIVTLEDPIEYVFHPKKSMIAQRQLGADMISFASGLKHVLRQDPNVIMIGEMRDLETIAAAMTLAETGHLVLATLHTYSAAQTVDRIIDIFPPYQQNQIRSQLSGVLTAVISQRLLPKNGGGRISAREILINNNAVANLIREGKLAQIKSTLETGAAAGMMTLDKHLKQLYQAGLIDRENALRQVEDPEFLDS